MKRTILVCHAVPGTRGAQAFTSLRAVSLGRRRGGLAWLHVDLPARSDADAFPAARVIVECELLERTRIELAILGELERDLRHSVGLPRRVQSEDVGLGLLRANDGVQDRRHHEDV